MLAQLLRSEYDVWPCRLYEPVQLSGDRLIYARICKRSVRPLLYEAVVSDGTAETS